MNTAYASVDGVDLGAAARFQPRTVEERFRRLHELDPHFASVWLSYFRGLYERPGLDVRTRMLVLVGQYTMLGQPKQLAETIEAALAESVAPREVLEVIFQCYTYAGDVRLSLGVDIFYEVADRQGVLDDVRKRGLPADATSNGRSLEAERETWSPDDRDDPRLPDLLERHGWLGVSTALRLRPGQQINTIARLDALDSGIASLWLDAIYAGLYARGVLDDKTRLLCMVGDCLSVGEAHQAPRHMRGALRQGASPVEVLEVVFQSFHIAGHAHLMGTAVDDAIAVIESEGRLDEVVDPDVQEAFLRIVRARMAKRHGVEELKADDGR